MKRICYLHIGGPKTGTSSIQLFLSENRDSLNRHGLLFPRSVGQPASTLFPLLFDFPSKQIYCRFGAFNGLQRSRLKQFIRKRLESELASCPALDLIISSEELWELEIDSLHLLQEYLLSLGYNKIIIIAYLRHQLDVACSSMTTWSTNGLSLVELPLPSDPLVAEATSFLDKLTIWSIVFGASNIVAVQYDPLNSVSQFLSSIGLQGSLFKSPAMNINSSIANQGISYLASFNKIFPRYIFGRFLNPLRVLVPIQYLRGRYSGQYRPTNSEILTYQHHYEKENRQIMEGFGVSLNSRYSLDSNDVLTDIPNLYRLAHLFISGHISMLRSIRLRPKFPRPDVVEQIYWFIRINILS